MKNVDNGVNGILGIDAGGTFTDLAFLSGKELHLYAKAKIPTDHDDLIKTIRTGIDMILHNVNTEQIRSINLATTLATNAIVENKLRPVGLVLIGYDKDIVEKALVNDAFGTQCVISVAGGHDSRGNEIKPLDEDALIHAIDKLGEQVEAIAVSGYFSVRNTDHELRACKIIHDILPHIHITCGHELASDLDAVKRATTTVLNAGLIPIVMELLSSVEQVCHDKGMDVPIIIVRGDGSLVGAEWAKSHPVEMILSGPAASACGACFLASVGKTRKSSWVVDIGGTTTDIIRLHADGKPVLLSEGAIVGNHKTLVKAIDIHTFGLGGDSRAYYGHERTLILGPRRVRPLCQISMEYPEIIEELRWRSNSGLSVEPLFVFCGKGKTSSNFEKRILEKLVKGPQLIDDLIENEGLQNFCRIELERMEALGIVQFAAFTPTDALHVLKLLDKWNNEASFLGAKLLMQEDRHLTPEAFAEDVLNLAVRNISSRLFCKSFSLDGMDLNPNGEGRRLIHFALLQHGSLESQIHLELNATLIGVGAPTWAFISKVGMLLHETAVQPKNADVAGAIGAAVGYFSLHYAVRISPCSDGTYRVHHPLGITDYDDLEQAVDETCCFMKPWLIERARKAGAKDPKVIWDRKDEEARLCSGYKKYLWTQLSFNVLDEKEIV